MPLTKERFAEIALRVDSLQTQYSRRDQFAMQVRAVRSGDFDQIAPGIFPEDWPRPVCANIIDNMARDFAAKLAPLPAFNCSSASTLSDAKRKFADKRAKIARNYVEASRLGSQMPEAADSYNCYGMAVFSVEPDKDAMLPIIRAEDSANVYPVWDRNMRTKAVAKVFYAFANELEGVYPRLKQILKEKPGARVGGDRLKVVKWADEQCCVTYLPDCGDAILEYYENPIGRCMYVCVPRPNGHGTFGGVIRGQYDDLVWPQLARNEFQILALEAADKAVRAPIVVPPDVTELSFGPDAVMQTANPAGVGRLRIDVPPASFTAMEWLREDMQLGGMSPPARSGQADASIITGAGMDALMEGYSTQLAQAQEMMKFALEQCIELCFLIDEKIWPNVRKTVRGQDAGVPFEVDYTPSKDIAGDHSIDVQYGFLAGLDANRSLIYILQAYGAGLISGDYAMRNLPAAFNVSEERKKIELENVRKAILEGAIASAQAIPQLAMQGGDPSMLMGQLSKLAELIGKGKEVEDAATEAFAPPPPPPEMLAPGVPAPAEAAPGSEGAPPQGGGASLPPQQSGPPDLMYLMAGLTNRGTSNLQANVSRPVPI
jgi:hypothetical protein